MVKDHPTVQVVIFLHPHCRLYVFAEAQKPVRPVHIFFRMVMNISGLFSMITILINGFGSLKDKAAFSVSNYVETSILTTIFS